MAEGMNNRTAVGAVVLGLLVAAPMAALAQSTPSPGQLSPRSVAPRVQQDPTGVSLPAPPSAGAPAGSERISLRPRLVVVEDGDQALDAETRAIVRPLEGRSVAASEVYAAAARIEALYAARGFFLTRVVVPPQTVRPGGDLRLRVVRGYLDSIDVSSLPREVAARVAAVTAPLIGQRGLTLGEFERRLLIAGETPGLTLRTVLTPGREPGAVSLRLEGRHRVVSGEISVDNSNARALGTWSLGTAVSLNSALGLGETVYASIAGVPGSDFLQANTPRRLFGAGVILPLGIDGLSINPELTYSTTRPRVDPGALPTSSEFIRASVRLLYPFIRSRTSSLVGRLGLDLTEETQRAPTFDNATLYRDRYNAVRLGLDGSHLVGVTGTLLSAGADFSQGIRGLGSRGAAEATPLQPLSRQGSSDTFSKIELRARLVQPLPAGFAFDLTARAQYSFSGALFNAERFILGGTRALSAYPAGTFSGDHGWLVRGELSWTNQVFNGTWGGLTPYVFGSRGQVFNVNPTAVEQKSITASALGLGARMQVALDPLIGPGRTAELSVEAARQFSNDPLRREEWRFNVSGAVRF